jgi:hypothetical protein
LRGTDSDSRAAAAKNRVRAGGACPRLPYAIDHRQVTHVRAASSAREQRQEDGLMTVAVFAAAQSSARIHLPLLPAAG